MKSFMSLHVLKNIDFLHWFDDIAMLAWLKSAQRSRNVARLTPQLGGQADLCDLLYIWLLFCYLEAEVKLQVVYILWAW